MKNVVMLFLFVLTSRLLAIELSIQKTEINRGDCLQSYSFAEHSLLGCGHMMKFQEASKDIGKKINLTDMNVKGMRAFVDGSQILSVIDIGDEGNSALFFYSISGDKVRELGSADIMTASEERTALAAAKYSKALDKIEIRFDTEVGKLNRKGIFQALQDVLVTIDGTKVSVSSKEKSTKPAK